MPPAARNKAQRLLGWAKLTADWAEAPSADEVTARDDDRMLTGADWSAEVEGANRAAVDRLVAEFSAEQLAAAYVRLYRERRSAPEELSDPASAPAPRAAFGPSAWFSIEGGRATGAEPRRILPMLCKLGDLTREDIGAIRIEPEAALFEIRQEAVAGFLAAIGPAMVLEEGAALTRLSDPPGARRAPRREKPASSPAPSSGAKGPASPVRTSPPADPVRPADTPPVDWNDTPAPRPGKAGRKARKPGSPHPKPETRGNAEVTAARPRHEGKPKPRAKPPGDLSDPSRSARGARPPVGKPSSKKNRARQLARAEAGAAACPYDNF